LFNTVEQIMHHAKLVSCFGILMLVGAGQAAFAQNATQPAKTNVAASVQKPDPGSLRPAKMALAVAPQSLATDKMGSGTTMTRLAGAQANKVVASDNSTGRAFNGQLKVVAH
jgi:hypothetical protein